MCNRPPRTFRRGQISSHNLPPSPTLYFGLLLCVSSSLGGPPRLSSVFFHFIFCRSNSHQNRRVMVLPQRSATAKSLPKYPTHRWYCFRLVVALVWLGAAAQGRCPVPLSLFFVAPFAAHNDRKRFSQRILPRSRRRSLSTPSAPTRPHPAALTIRLHLAAPTS